MNSPATTLLAPSLTLKSLANPQVTDAMKAAQAVLAGHRTPAQAAAAQLTDAKRADIRRQGTSNLPAVGENVRLSGCCSHGITSLHCRRRC